jgi:acyl-coenzyme A thioesterase PaaI-like protein
MITQTQTTSFKEELYEGIHDLLTDTIKIALYTANADLGASTTVYTTDQEVTGTGYTAGGVTVTNVTVASSGTTAYVSFDNPQWTGASFTCRGALIYNSSKANRSIAVLNFGNDKIVANGTFTVTMPANTATTALIRSQ